LPKKRTFDFKNSVKLMFECGWSLSEIAERKNANIDEIEKIISESKKRLFKPKPSSLILGSKTEPYYKTEEEMINPPVYKYEDLSKEEKLFYESWNNK
jgi:hypothetical protein